MTYDTYTQVESFVHIVDCHIRIDNQLRHKNMTNCFVDLTYHYHENHRCSFYTNEINKYISTNTHLINVSTQTHRCTYQGDIFIPINSVITWWFLFVFDLICLVIVTCTAYCSYDEHKYRIEQQQREDWLHSFL